MPPLALSRRSVLQSLAALAATSALPSLADTPDTSALPDPLLSELPYSAVTVRSALHTAQLENTRSILMGLSDDSLLMPLRQMANRPAPGVDIGGWYAFRPDYNFRHDDAGFCPAASLGQWISALARMHAITGDPAPRDKALRLTAALGNDISPAFFDQTRFPAYTFDKLVGGLTDTHRLLHDPSALPTLERVTDAALPSLPGHAIERELAWRLGKDISWMWDESFTLPENLYLAAAAGAGPRYRTLARQYLADSFYFDPLARGEDVLPDKQAYSYINALSSAMQASIADSSSKHRTAARNGFDLLTAQSYATGGWGPDEDLRNPARDELFKSLTLSHNSFEAPCGSYAHLKLTRYLLRTSGDGRFGDSMERTLWNSVLGALPLQPDGRSFYSADYSNSARKIYSLHRWPCCSGTLPQVAADHGINAYLTSPDALWVNLYLPSAVHTTLSGGAEITLEQIPNPDGIDYPFSPSIPIRLTLPHPTELTLHLRIPSWCDHPTLTLNHRPQPLSPRAGFASITRTWHTGDRLDLNLPARLELAPLTPADALRHPEVAALTFGPLVLFPLAPGPVPLTRAQALAARRLSPRTWQIDLPAGPLRLAPFVDIDADTTYSTYLKLT